MFDKLDAYNLVANLVPGAALTYALHTSGLATPDPEKYGAFLLVSFVVGVTANRLGSLVIDPWLRKRRFLKPKDYISFLVSEEHDSKLDALVANAGLYRTFFVTGLLYLLAVDLLLFAGESSTNDLLVCLVGGWTIIFLFALRKEDNYIHQRLRKNRSISSDQGA